MLESLNDLGQQRAAILRQISELEDFRAASITGTGGRCGNPEDPGQQGAGSLE